MLELRIYTDDTLETVKEVRNVERIKIPYRVGQYVINAIREVDIDDGMQILQKVLNSEEQLTKVVKATFRLSENDLACVDMMELGDVAMQIFAFVVSKFTELNPGNTGGGNEAPNAQAPA